MSTENFDPDKFAQNMAQQAQDFIPADISDNNKKFLVNILYKFCAMAGSAIVQDKNINLTTQQAIIVTQFIGEWTFHKTIDLARSEIPQEYWEQPILQKIAFAVFEAAKDAQIRNVDQNNTVRLIEDQVNISYEETIKELYNSKLITNAQMSSALNQSNIDKMAQPNSSQESKTKKHNLKLATLAAILKKLPQNTVDNILINLDENDVKIIKSFMGIPDLENQISPTDSFDLIQELKAIVPDASSVKNQNIAEIIKMTNKLPSTRCNAMFDNERSCIKELIENCRKKDVDKLNDTKLTPKATSIIMKYIKEKAGTNKNQ